MYTNICPLTGVIVLVILSQSVVVRHLLLETSKCDCGLAKHEVTVSPSKYKWFQLYFCCISRFKWLYNPKQMNLPGILGIWLGKISLGVFQSDQSSLEVIFVSGFTTIRIKEWCYSLLLASFAIFFWLWGKLIKRTFVFHLGEQLSQHGTDF